MGCVNFLSGEAGAADLSAMLLLPCVVTFVLTRRTRHKGLFYTAVFLWLICVLVVPQKLLMNLLGSLWVIGMTVLIRWVVRRIRKVSAKNRS